MLKRAAFLALLAITAPAIAAAQKSPAALRESAQAQFDRAQKQRAWLEAVPPAKRTADDYLQLVKSYRRVYLTTPTARDSAFSILTVSDLYRQMGSRFDGKYFQSAVENYQFLLKNYPGSRYREDALFSIGQIQKDDFNNPSLAQKTFEEFLKLHPRSPRAKDAQAALVQLAAPRNSGTPSAHRVTPPVVTPNSPPAYEPSAAPTKLSPAQMMEEPSADKVAEMREIKAWTTPDYTRVVIALDGPIKYQAARIANPDRIYFDVNRARLSRTLGGAPVTAQGDLLKGIRVAQYKDGVVRVVLEISKIKDYSVFLLRDPYRMVVDIYPKSAPSTTTAQGNSPRSESTEELAADAALAKANSPQLSKPSQTGHQPNTSSASNDSVSKAPPLTRTPINNRTIHTTSAKVTPPPVPAPPRDGQQSLTRALGLKIGRIVIDAGHGGHDTGTIGPNGLMEKDLCLDVALRLGKMIEDNLPGTEIVYTRSDDTFVPLEERTAMANQAKADLFISIHANSSPDPSARGVETYYLNLSPSPEAMEVAARENATAQGNIHDLEDMIQRITRNEKIEESRELAGDIQDSLSKRLQKANHAIKNRGVRKAPFVVLLGANMPSVLAEISFISNPADETSLKRPDGRDRVAEGLYKGIEAYLQNINSLASNHSRTSPGSRPGVAQLGNQR